MRGARTYTDQLKMLGIANTMQQQLETMSRGVAQAMDENLIREWSHLLKGPLGTRARKHWDEYPPWFQNFIKRTWWDKMKDIPNG